MHRITEVSIYRIEGVFLLNHPLASPCFYADLSTHLINQGPDRRDSSFVNTVPVSNFVYQNTTGSFFNRYRIDIVSISDIHRHLAYFELVAYLA